MDPDLVMLTIVVVAALAFDFTNGFHDVGNIMAVPISTGALRPRTAVALAAILNFAGAFVGLSVAATIATGIVDTGVVRLPVVFAGLAGGIIWNLVTWLFCLPSSSSHALVGGVVGATLVEAGADAVIVGGLVGDVMVPAVVAPVLAGVVALLATRWLYRFHVQVRDVHATGVYRSYRAGQIGTASLLAIAHGSNDAQKTMGIITLALIVQGSLTHDQGTPLWVVFACALAMGLGMYLGGWRIIRTLGRGLADIAAPQGFAAMGSSAVVILVSSNAGIPLSTTHIATGSILGSGLGRRKSHVRWGVAGSMAIAWLITLPCAGLVGALAIALTNVVGGMPGFLLLTGALVAVVGVIVRLSRRSPVGPDSVNDEWQPEDARVGPHRASSGTSPLEDGPDPG